MHLPVASVEFRVHIDLKGPSRCCHQPACQRPDALGSIRVELLEVAAEAVLTPPDPGIDTQF